MATRKGTTKAGRGPAAAKRRGSKTATPTKRTRKVTAQKNSALVDVARSIGTTLGKVTVKTREMTEKTREAIKAKMPQG